MQNKDADLTFFQEWWKIFRKYQNPPRQEDSTKEANEFWLSIINDTEKLSKQYESNENYDFYVNMSANLVYEIKRRSEK